MMNFVLAATLFVASRSATYSLSTDGTACMNYVLYPGQLLYPVGVCYNEDFSPSDSPYATESGSIFMCEDDGNGGLRAVQYRTGPNCNTNNRTATGYYVACNGPEMNQTCSCEIGGNAAECDLSMETIYEWEYDLVGGIRATCDLTRGTHSRFVTNMCIQIGWDTSNFYKSISYGCKGYTYIGPEQYEDTFCGSFSPTSEPTVSPTTTSQSPNMTTTAYYDLSCTEMECAGTQGPRVQDSAAVYQVFGAVLAVFASLLF